jgi:hypothetical protein
MRTGLHLCAVVVVASVLIASGCGSKEHVSPEDTLTPMQRHDALLAEMFAAQKKGQQETITSVERAYARLFPSTVRDAIVSKADRASLDYLFDAADITASNTLDEKHVRDALAAFDAMEGTGGATDEQVSVMRDLMVKARLFEPQPKFALPRLQDESQGNRPTELVVASDVLIRRAIPMTGLQIIVVAHPRCGFSAAAMRDITNDAAMARIFADKARWLIPQEASADLDRVLEASKQGVQYRLAYKRSEFPMIDSWQTPTFYFLDGARVVRKVVGWPKEGRMQELRDGAQAIGLAP